MSYHDAWRASADRRALTVLLGAALLMPVPAAFAQATAQGRSLTRTRSSERDSVRARQERLLLRFDSLRQEFEHQRLSQSERERMSDEMRRTMLALQEAFLDAGGRTRASVVAQLEMERARAAAGAVPPPFGMAVQTRNRVRGYLGLSFDGPYVPVPHRSETVIRFLDYPHIALVEPSSPAERAGILQGDTLVAFNGTDVREREISFTKLLVPRRRVTVRVRRDGDARDLRVTVGEAPSYVISRAMPIPPMPRPPVASTAPGASEAPMPLPALSGRVEAAVPAPRAPMPEGVAPGAARVGTIWLYNEGVAGAQVETITDGLGRALGVRSGVLVIRARPGTPAYRSGLRDGDVILGASGRDISSVRELLSVLANGDGQDGVKLEIRRERRSRELTLRWQ